MTLSGTVAEPPHKDVALVVREIAASVGADGIDCRSALARSDKRPYALFLLFAFVLLIAPIDFILPQLAALTLVLCGLALFAGAPAPWMPPFISNLRVKKEGLLKLAAFLEQQMSWSLLIVTPRFAEFAAGGIEKLAGLAMILLGVAVAVPPMPDVIPALAVLALGLGLLQRDGLVMLIGVAVAIGWIAFLGAMGAGLVMHAPYATGWVQDHAPWAAELVKSAVLAPSGK